MIKRTICELSSDTPLYEMNLNNNNKLYIKMENLNPSGSIKDRVFKTVIEAYEKKGVIHPGDTLLVASSGNAAISLTVVGHAKGYEVVCYLPSTTTQSRREILSALCAKAYYVDGGMSRCQDLAKEDGKQKGCLFIDQFDDVTTLLSHEDTVKEIHDDLDNLDCLVLGVGTGVTLKTFSDRLKEYYPKLKVYAYELDDVPFLTNNEHKAHKLEGVGPNFLPKNYLNSTVDEVIKINFNEVLAKERELLRQGLLVGPTTAGCVLAATKLNVKNQKILTVCYDGYDKYLEVIHSHETKE